MHMSPWCVSAATDERLRVTFTNIDPQAPTRAFTFQVYVDTSDRYHGALLAFLPTCPAAHAAPVCSSPLGLAHVHVPPMLGRRPPPPQSTTASPQCPTCRPSSTRCASMSQRRAPAITWLAAAAVPCHVASLSCAGQAIAHANSRRGIDAFFTHPGSTAPMTSARSSAACERASSFS